MSLGLYLCSACNGRTTNALDDDDNDDKISVMVRLIDRLGKQNK